MLMLKEMSKTTNTSKRPIFLGTEEGRKGSAYRKHINPGVLSSCLLPLASPAITSGHLAQIAFQLEKANDSLVRTLNNVTGIRLFSCLIFITTKA